MKRKSTYLFSFILLVLLSTAVVLAASVTQIVGTGANDASVGTAAWTNPGNITANEAAFSEVYSSVYLVSLATSNYIKATSFSFAIPVGATINGIIVTLERRDNQGTGLVLDATARLVKGGVISGDNKASTVGWDGDFETINYGSSSDLWGLAWTAADINASNFGFVLNATQSSAELEGEAALDYISITVHCTTTSGTASATTMLIGSN